MRNDANIGSRFVAELRSIINPGQWLVLCLIVGLGSPGASIAALVDLKYVSKSGEFLAKCSPAAKEARFSVQGPGVVHVKYTLEPYRRGIWTLHIPISWTLYKADGSHSGWGHFPNLGHYENGGLPYKITQAGKPVKGNYIDGLPLESESAALVSNNKYTIGVQLGGTCALQGSTYTQWGQVNRLTVSFSPGSPGAAKPTDSDARDELAGQWQYRSGSFTDVHEFLPGGKMGNNMQGTWETRGNRLTVRWSNGWANIYTLVPGAAQLTGVNQGPNGQNNRITLTRKAAPSSTNPEPATQAPDKADSGTTNASHILFDNGNSGSVHNRPSRPTTFTVSKSTRITLIQNYHWNSGKGASPGFITLRNDDGGQSVGRWQASGLKGQGGAIVYWACRPDVVLAPGRYTVADSDPSTWSQNSGSGGAGMTHVEGHAAR